MSTNESSWRVAPLEHVVHLEGHVAQKKQKRQVEPLEHVVCPEGHIALMMMKEQTYMALIHLTH